MAKLTEGRHVINSAPHKGKTREMVVYIEKSHKRHGVQKYSSVTRFEYK